ncbi:MAG TPA: type II toxin-antitoxin system VapB family antitoxin [Thermoanaerobaculia bacterium]|nr:type II toxin-antitoxin system VapB family antitoxin [Thermoanaerobaculia bacterium]
MSVDLHIDDRLIEKAIEAGQHQTAEEAVTTALEEYIRSHEAPELPVDDAEARERMKILEWVGKVDYFDDYDHKELRRRKIR